MGRGDHSSWHTEPSPPFLYPLPPFFSFCSLYLSLTQDHLCCSLCVLSAEDHFLSWSQYVGVSRLLLLLLLWHWWKGGPNACFLGKILHWYLKIFPHPTDANRCIAHIYKITYTSVSAYICVFDKLWPPLDEKININLNLISLFHEKMSHCIWSWQEQYFSGIYISFPALNAIIKGYFFPNFNSWVRRLIEL